MTYSALAKELNHLIRRALSENAEAMSCAGAACRDVLGAGGQILVFGNGGSAAEAQHFAAELVNKFSAARPALRAVSLTTDTSVLTSVANDVSFSAIFSRQIEALGRAGDVALALSTSGSSPNVVRGLAAARKRGLITIGLTGSAEGKMGPLCDFLFRVPSPSTPRIQEVHLVLLHLLVAEIEREVLRDRP
jgi:D-sedoheptulose 7-phosphate isomerase